MLDRSMIAQRISRRRLGRLFAGASVLGTTSALLSACGASTTATPMPKKPAESAKPAGDATKPAAPTLAAIATKPAAGGATPAAATPAAAGPIVRMAFVPSANSARVLANGEPLGAMLGRMTGYRFEVSVPTSYAAVIEAMGSNRVDVGWLAPFAYVLAHEKYGVEVLLVTTRQNTQTYVAQIIAHVDSSVNALEDLRSRKFAFVDSASASGYLYPAALLKERGFEPSEFFSEVVHAGGHDKVVIAVYNKQVDGGATFGRSTSDPNAPLTDARTLVRSTLPDVLDKVKIIAETDPIPNDTVSVRKGLDPAIVDNLKTALLQVAQDEEGKKLLAGLYQIDGLVETNNAFFDPIRRKAQLVGLNIEQSVIPPAKPTTAAGTVTPAGAATPAAPATATSSPAGTPKPSGTTAPKPAGTASPKP